MRATKALTRLRRCAGSSEPLLLSGAISVASFVYSMCLKFTAEYVSHSDITSNLIIVSRV